MTQPSRNVYLLQACTMLPFGPPPRWGHYCSIFRHAIREPSSPKPTSGLLPINLYTERISLGCQRWERETVRIHRHAGQTDMESPEQGDEARQMPQTYQRHRIFHDPL